MGNKNKVVSISKDVSDISGKKVISLSKNQSLNGEANISVTKINPEDIKTFSVRRIAKDIGGFFNRLFYPSRVVLHNKSNGDKDVGVDQLSFKEGEIWKLYNSLASISYEREKVIHDYEMMGEDPIVQSAEDTLIEDMFMPTEDGKSVWFVCKDEKLQKLADELLETICIDEKIVLWGKTLVRYGVCPLRIQGFEGEGVIRVQDGIHPLDYWRIDSGILLGYFSKYDLDSDGNKKFLAPWEFSEIKWGGFGKLKKIEEKTQLLYGNNDYIYLENQDIYGYLEPARSVYKKLRLIEDSLIMGRLDRTPKKRFWLINAPGVEPSQSLELATQFGSNLKNQMDFDVDELIKKDKFFSTYGQDVIIPYGKGITGVDMKEIGGELDVGHIVDIELWRDKFFGALRCPKFYLGITNDLPSNLGESAAVKISIRWARVVKRGRRAINNFLFRLLQIHCAYMGYFLKRDDVYVMASFISSAEEEEIKSALEKSANVLGDLVSILRDLGVNVEGNEAFIKWAVLDFLKLTGLKIEELLNVVETEDKTVNIAGLEGDVRKDIKQMVNEILLEKRYNNTGYSRSDEMWTFYNRKEWDKIVRENLKGELPNFKGVTKFY